MGKGKKSSAESKSSARRSGRGDDENEDARSTTSFETADSTTSDNRRFAGGNADELFGDGGSEGEGDPLSLAADKLTEKRGSTRVEGLGELLEILQSGSDLEAVESKRATLLDGLLNCLRRPSTESEAQLAARALAALCVCLGPEEDALYRQLSRLLQSGVTRGRNVAARVEACNALAISCFICSSEADVQDEAMALLAAVFSRSSEGEAVPDELVAAALQGWCLLATSVPPQWLAGTAVNAYLPTLRELLDSSSMDVRVAAGECSALLREAVDDVIRIQADEEDSAEPNSANSAISSSSGDVYTAADEYGEMDDVWEDIASKMLAYSNETSKKLSKDAKKEQRKVFRELYSCIMEGAPPSQDELALQNGSLEATTWAEVKRIDCLRACLQSGFQLQLQNNEYLRDMLNIQHAEGGVLRGAGGGGSSGIILSKSSGVRKWRSEARSRQRASRQSAKDNFLHSGDHDEA